MLVYTLEPNELKDLIKTAIAEQLSVLNLANSPPIDRIYNLEEAAIFLNLSKHTVAKYARLGLLKRAMPHIKGFRFNYDELKRFASEYRTH
jgi:hypothetical protein